MASENYQAVMYSNTTFNQPRQTQWAVLSKGMYGWDIKTIDPSLAKVEQAAKNILASGGEYTNINKIMVVQIMPLDFIMTPNV
ncbi:hypothetical protein [Clostridium sp. JS66]|uniref:hypothetical protein n=1 Tax=Clostridium sp. JS66 TaxID=3064705 RepID=UPI00298E35CE|nr:hypothetical protein [Clostridium sp. JS66]WPC42973.1 hypothetical protein Q6H37_05735 [Clostridium sp. JS66]